MTTVRNTLAICTFVALGAATCAWGAETVPASERMFVREAAAGGMAEVELGKLAQEKASAQNVKDFGKKMVDDHSKAGDDLKSVASKHQIELPAKMDAKDQALYDRLSKLSGKAFDHSYVTAMLRDHRKDVADFQKEAGHGKNADVKDFATRTLPVLQEHLKLIEGLASAR